MTLLTTLILVLALGLTFAPIVFGIWKVLRTLFERGPVEISYRGEDGVEYTDRVDTRDPVSIGEFLSLVRQRRIAAGDTDEVPTGATHEP